MHGRATINITTETPSCVLIRAVEPASEWEPKWSTVGPINIAKALGIRYSPNELANAGSVDGTDITQIGPPFICQGQDIPPGQRRGDKEEESKGRHRRTTALHKGQQVCFIKQVIKLKHQPNQVCGRLRQPRNFVL